MVMRVDLPVALEKCFDRMLDLQNQSGSFPAFRDINHEENEPCRPFSRQY